MITKQPRGLVFDLETSPIISYTWGIWQQDVIEVIDDWKILSVAWQWVGEKKVHVLGQDDYKSYKPGVNDDKDLVKDIWKLLDECDYAVAHNGDQFDIKKCNTRFLIHKLPPPSDYRQVDTKKIAKRVAGFTSNRLKDLAKNLDVNQKGDPGGFGTWKGCLAGDKKAWAKLKKYNKQDIPPLMDLHLIFRAWDKSAVPQNVLTGRPDACPRCGREGTMQKWNQYRATNTNLYQYYRCKECKGMAKSRVAEYKQSMERMKYVT